MSAELDTILGNLHSDEARLTFLRSIYVPGNTDVADRILSMSTNSSVIEKEIEHARQVGDTDRFVTMAKKEIDFHVDNGFKNLLKDRVIRWQDVDVADYAIARMTSVPEDNRILEFSLEYVAEIAQAFGKEEFAKQNLERLLTLQERDSEYKFSVAHTLIKLGRFDEAIDRYLEGGYHDIPSALNVAQEHSPTRITEVAQKGFDDYKQGSGFEEFYVECAEIVGKTRQAEKPLLDYAKKVKIESKPRFYDGLVKSLVKLGHEKEAKQLVEKVARHEESEKNSDRHYEFDRPEEMAGLYHAIGETDAVRNIYSERIDTRIREGGRPSNTLNDIRKIIELTGDNTFREKELALYERQKEYDKAEILATELGKPELAETYSTMHQMVLTVQAQPSN